MNVKTREEELQLLLELKKKQDNEKTEQDKLDMERLNETYQEYKFMTAEQMEESFENKSSVLLQNTSDLDLILQDYNDLYSLKPGYQKPVTRDGKTKLVFESEQAAVEFALDQAVKGRAFKLLDNQHRLIAYSNGNGMLFHASGEAFKPGEQAFNPAKTTALNLKGKLPIPPSTPEITPNSNSFKAG